ncbi:MAG TPA: response regulator [Candidatus Polarisedimenticolia bacterium]|nr:response regulator [Candidatus Polarisedimenticolia bacterium]
MPGKIMVADDSPNIREILKVSLESDGYTVVLAEDGEQALALVGRENPDVVIMDVMMPKVNGFQVCRRIKTDPATLELPVIMLTAKSAQQDVYWGKDCGAEEYITKPFSTKELVKTIDRLMKGRHKPGADPSGVAEELRLRIARGEAGQIVHLEWDPRALDVFRKKYGEFKFSEARNLFRGAAEQFLKDQNDAGPVEVHDTVGISVVLRGTPSQAKKTGARLARRLNDVAAGLYDAEDRDRGHIPFRDPRSATEEKLPLLSFSPRIARDKAA